MHRWGYTPSIETLADELLGGTITQAELRTAIVDDPRFHVVDGFVCLRGFEGLAETSCLRTATNRLLGQDARAIAREYARELLRACPIVDCIGMSGSLASGGFGPDDDIDFDLFVEDGAKYLVYAFALALGFRTSLRHANGGGLRKLICINVVWTRQQTFPFERTDEALAFELLHCSPIFGGAHFERVIEGNPWVTALFPQITRRTLGREPVPEPSLVGRVLRWIVKHPRLLRPIEATARALSFAGYTLVHWFKRHDEEARERLAFLQRVKYPYEVFQD